MIMITIIYFNFDYFHMISIINHDYILLNVY